MGPVPSDAAVCFEISCSTLVPSVNQEMLQLAAHSPRGVTGSEAVGVQGWRGALCVLPDAELHHLIESQINSVM